MNALIFGPPGSGKGTYASRLQPILNIEVIAMGDIFREMLKQDTELGKKIKGYVEKGLLVPDDIVIRVLQQHIAKVPKGKGVLLDGFPRNIAQAEALEDLAKIDFILLQMAPDWIIIERLSSRRICKTCSAVYNTRFLKPQVEGTCDKCGGQLYQRPDDNPEVIKKRIDIYQEQTSPILRYYKEKNTPFVISSITKLDTPPEPIVHEIVRELKKRKLI